MEDKSGKARRRAAADSIDCGQASPGFVPPGEADLAWADARFVLVEPSHCGNIGSAARAIRAMGFEQLAVVAPRDADYRKSADALALATHATAVLANSVATPRLEDALTDVTLSFAMTGYEREFGPPHVALRQAAQQAAHWLRKGRGGVAFVFGTERSGLLNRDVQRCHFSCNIPADAAAASMNLAQAVQVTAYELRCALSDAVPAESTTRERASVEKMERLYQQLEQALTDAGFHNPQQPKRLMERLRTLFARAALDPSEADLWLGICAAIAQPKHLRIGRKRGTGEGNC